MKCLKRFTIYMLICILLMNTALVVSADDETQSGIPLRDRYASETPLDKTESLLSYIETQETYAQKGYLPVLDGTRLELPISQAHSSDGSPLSFKQDGEVKYLEWTSDCEQLEWTVSIETAGIYTMSLYYSLLPGESQNADRYLKIDGKTPFKEASSIRFYRYWRDAYKPKVNNIGNQVQPKQEEITGWRTVSLIDSQGLSTLPFEFYFSEGKHSIQLGFVNTTMCIQGIALFAPEYPASYSEVEKTYKELGYKEASSTLEFEAEESVMEKNDSSIRRENAGDPSVTPMAYDVIKLNIMGGTNWRKGNQSITWEFTVPEDGLYRLYLRMAHKAGDGLPAYRQIQIDDKVPFSELLAYRFDFDRDWRTQFIEDEFGEPYLFYLTAGSHTLTMVNKVGNLSKAVQSLNECNKTLSNLIRRIVAYTGPSPDVNYEYNLEINIPGIREVIADLRENTIKIMEEIKIESSKTPSAYGTLKTVTNLLSRIEKEPDDIPRVFNDLTNAMNTYGSLASGLQEMSLFLDRIGIASPSEQIEDKRSNFFEKVWTTLVNFGYSFVKDYNAVGSIAGDYQIHSTIGVWIARGREWGELIKEIADEDFTPQTGIGVNVNILPTSAANAGAINPIMLAISSGTAPDVAMGVSSGSPSEFAFRNAVVDLSTLEDYAQISQRFIPEMLVPYTINDGIYALPETINFKLMYYRKDICEELGINPPNTWQELYQKVLPVINQNGLQFYTPGLFDVFLYQHGGAYYSDDGSSSALDSPEAFAAFKESCELNTVYGIPVTVNLLNRFRTGELVMAISDFGFYTMLTAAAPELSGVWGVCPIPQQSESGVQNSVGGASVDSIIILKQSQKADESWDFLSWWTSDYAQEQFAYRIEARLGISARWCSANINALKSLPWKSNERQILNEYFSMIKETPVYLGGYFSSRHITNAWNRVVVSSDPLYQGTSGMRDSLELAIKDINKELKRKQEQYGVYQGND